MEKMTTVRVSKKTLPVTVYFSGGIGNQLFQYYFPFVNGLKPERAFFLYNPLREFELSAFFEHEVTTLSFSELKFFDREYSRIHRFCLLAQTKFDIPIPLSSSLFKSYHGYSRRHQPVKRRYNNFYGYMQYGHTLCLHREAIRQHFAKHNTEKNNAEMDEKSCVISIRLGTDYFQDKSLDIFDESWFLSAINRKKEIGISKFVVFSDLPEKASALFSVVDGDFTHVESSSLLDQLSIMAQYRHFIISNSRFSWWGAFLSEAKLEDVIAPTHWYADKLNNELEIFG